MSARAYYFGCVRERGHALWAPDLRQPIPYTQWPDGLPWKEIDTALLRSGDQIEGEVLTHHRGAWTAAAFWDRSVDTRRGSNSVILFEEHLSFDAAIARARKTFPSIFARFKFEVMEAKA